MATSNQLGDIPGARFNARIPGFASVASNGANGVLGHIGPFPYDIRLRNAWFTPTGADNAITNTGATASHRRVRVLNGGTAGTGTALMASRNLTASAASLGPLALTVDTAVTVPSGARLVVDQVTVGGALADGTTLAAGDLNLAYEII